MSRNHLRTTIAATIVAALFLSIIIFTTQSSITAQGVSALAMGTPPSANICEYRYAFLGRQALMNSEGVFDPAPLDIAQACGIRIFVKLHGSTDDIKLAEGGIDLVAYEDLINDFVGLIDPYVASGTIAAHMTIDEPHDCSDWNDVCPDTAEVDEAAHISKTYWPELSTFHITLPSYASSYNWIHTDSIQFSYAYHKGDLTEFVQDAVAVLNGGYIANISWGIQAMAGGCPVFGDCSMTPTQVEEVGTAMCDSNVGSPIVFLGYDTDLLDNDMRQTLDQIKLYCGDDWVTNYPFAIEGRVFADFDEDGIFDSAEDDALGDVTVTLTDSNSNTTDITTTAAGLYYFGGLAPLTYTLSINANDLPAGHNPPNDREFSIGNLVSTPWDIPIKVNLLGGMVFRDHDISGTYSETIDTLYADVVLILSDADGIPLTATMTDENGQYAFQALADGDYTITVDQGSLDLGWISDPQSKTRTVTVNTLYRSIDFAAQPPVGAVNGLVFADLNDNGTFDPTIEYALEGIDVKLTSLLNGSEFIAQTNADGSYSFTELALGGYAIDIVSSSLPPGHRNTYTPNIDVTDTPLTVDFDILVNGIFGFVFKDNNKDGDYDAPEDVPYPDVVMTLTASDNSVTTAVSDMAGNYEFRGLADGNYTVAVDEASLDEGWFSLIPGKPRSIVNSSSRFGVDFATQQQTIGGMFVSSSGTGTVDGVVFKDEDILTYDAASGVWDIYIDLSDVGVTVDLDAFAILDDGAILMSFNVPVAIAGVGSVDDSDIVKFIPTTTGAVTDGSFEMYLDGSSYDLSANGEDIDAIGFSPTGDLIISVAASGDVGFGTFRDEDMIVLDSVSNTWSLYFDGSDVGLSDSSSEDVWGTWLDSSNGNIYLSTAGAFTVTGASGDGADILLCAAPVIGDNTSCTFSSYWDGSLHGFAGQAIDGFALTSP